MDRPSGLRARPSFISSLDGSVAVDMAVLVGWLVHCGPNENTSSIIGQIAMIFDSDNNSA